jgi:hypothetical protein
MALSPEEVGKWISKNIDTEKIPEEGWDKFTEAVDWAYNRACEDCGKWREHKFGPGDYKGMGNGSV